MSSSRTVRGLMVGHVPCPICGHREMALRTVRVVLRKRSFKVWGDFLCVLPRDCRECGSHVPCDRWPELRPDGELADRIAAARKQLAAA